MDELTKAIDKLVEQKTFSLDAVGAIKDLRDKASSCETRLKSAEERIAAREMELRQRDSTIVARDAEIKKWADREAAIVAREAKMAELEQRAAVEWAKAQVWDSCFARLFGNRVVRETVTSSVPIEQSYSGGGGSFVSHHTKTDQVVREEG